jgi:hypothetical protein
VGDSSRGDEGAELVNDASLIAHEERRYRELIAAGYKPEQIVRCSHVPCSCLKANASGALAGLPVACGLA